MELLGELYDAAAGNAPFGSLAPKIAAAFNSRGCLLQVRNGFAGPIEHLAVTPNFTAELMATYDSYAQYDAMANRVPNHSTCSLSGGDNLNIRNLLQETPTYRQHTGAVQSYYYFDVILPIGGPDNAYGILGIHRSGMELPFNIEEKQFGEMFLPHLKRALQLREQLGRLNMRQKAMLQTLDTLALGVMLVTSAGQVQFANLVAENLLRRGSGLAITKNRLHATAPSADPEFQRLLRCANPAHGQPTAAGGLIRLPRQDANPISLSLYPFLPPDLSSADHAPSVLIFIGDPNLHRPPGREALAKMYRLTGAEAKLYEALLTGQRLQDYADSCSIGLQTVKTQLSCLFQKTGSARQTDLVRDGLSNPILSLVKEAQHQKAPPSKTLYNSIPRLGDKRRASGIDRATTP